MTKPTITTSAITSEELNFLIFRYLQESGFTHASFALGYEGGINKSHIDGNLIPPGALVTIVQKGLQYIELEANLDDVNPLGSDEYSHLQPLDIITKNVPELQNIIKDKKNKLILEHDDGCEKEKDMKERDKETGREKEKDMKERDKETGREKEKVAIEKEQEREKEKDKQQEEHNSINNKEDNETSRKRPRIDENGCSAETMDASIPTSPSIPHVISSSEVTILEGHTSEVFACAWSPTGPLLASGSGDSTARIWTVPDSTCGSNAQTQPSCVQILKHYKGKLEKSKDVTTLDWNGEGSLLATGSYDGQARIWSTDGELKATLIRHKGPIFSLKWNKKGDYLLSGSVDKTAIVWDTRTWECKQQFECHSAPTLDVDWRNNTSFAACSTDSSIHVCKIGENNAVKQFKGHKGEVNAIKWDPTGVLLASCSDDTTAKIWSLKHDKYIHDFRAHQREIYTIKWSPTGLGTCNASQQLLLASASFDSTIKLWEVEQGRLVHSLNGHRQPVYAVAFSPNGEHLASGSLDQCLNIWSVKEGKLIRTYSGGGGIFEVCWNKEGNKIAACFSNSTVMVMDFRM